MFAQFHINIGLFFWGAFLSILYSIPWSFIFIFTSFLGIKLFVSQDKEICSRIQQKIKLFSHTGDCGKGHGYFIGWMYFGNIVNNNITNYRSSEVWIITTENMYKYLCKDVSRENEIFKTFKEKKNKLNCNEKIELQKEIQLYQRCGTYGNAWYKKRQIGGECLKTLYYCEEQTLAIDNILKYYKEHKHVVALLHGKPGTGKTAVSFMIAQKLNASYCNTIKPWQPGDFINDIYCEARPCAENPLIICFDEIDGPLHKLLDCSILINKNVPTSILDKESWNRMLDDIDRGFFPHLLLIMTTNSNPEKIRERDEALLRKGRVHVEIKLKNLKKILNLN